MLPAKIIRAYKKIRIKILMLASMSFFIITSIIENDEKGYTKAFAAESLVFDAQFLRFIV